MAQATMSAPLAEALTIAVGDPYLFQEFAGLTVNTTTLPALTATTGSFPTPNAATLVANTATPTVVELLDAIVELRAALVAANVLK